MRSKHPNKEIEALLKELESLGWTIRLLKGHAWGLVRCPNNNSDCRCGKFCQMSIWSTPKDPTRFAKTVRSKALGCIYLTQDGYENE